MLGALLLATLGCCQTSSVFGASKSWRLQLQNEGEAVSGRLADVYLLEVSASTDSETTGQEAWDISDIMREEGLLLLLAFEKASGAESNQTNLFCIDGNNWANSTLNDGIRAIDMTPIMTSFGTPFYSPSGLSYFTDTLVVLDQGSPEDGVPQAVVYNIALKDVQQCSDFMAEGKVETFKNVLPHKRNVDSYYSSMTSTNDQFNGALFIVDNENRGNIYGTELVENKGALYVIPRYQHAIPLFSRFEEIITSGAMEENDAIYSVGLTRDKTTIFMTSLSRGHIISIDTNRLLSSIVPIKPTDFQHSFLDNTNKSSGYFVYAESDNFVYVLSEDKILLFSRGWDEALVLVDVGEIMEEQGHIPSCAIKTHRPDANYLFSFWSTEECYVVLATFVGNVDTDDIYLERIPFLQIEAILVPISLIVLFAILTAIVLYLWKLSKKPVTITDEESLFEKQSESDSAYSSIDM